MEQQPKSAPQSGLAFARDAYLASEFGRLRGDLQVTNTSAEPMRLKQVTLRIAKDKIVQSGRVSGRLPAGQTATVPINMPIAATLPPGTYDAEIEAAGSCGHAKIVVTPHMQLEFMPHTIPLISIDPVETHHTLIASNRGNIPLTLPDKIAVGLSPDNAVTDALLQGLKAVGKKGFQDLTDAVTAYLSESQPWPALLRFEQAGETLAPGETRAIEVTIELPDGLRPNVRYTGFGNVFNTSISVTAQAYSVEPQPNSDKKKHRKEDEQ